LTYLACISITAVTYWLYTIFFQTIRLVSWAALWKIISAGEVPHKVKKATLIPLIKEQFPVTHCYTVLLETETAGQIFTKLTFKHVLWKWREKQFLYRIFTEGVSVNQVSSHASISVWLTMWLWHIAVSWWMSTVSKFESHQFLSICLFLTLFLKV
jgi:hypothetical protein